MQGVLEFLFQRLPDRPLRDGLQCTAMIPYANLLLDGGDAFRPLPREAVLERRPLPGYALRTG